MKNKTYLCVDNDGTEKISNSVPIRRFGINGIFWGMIRFKMTRNQSKKWCDGWSTEDGNHLPFYGTILPTGTIEKLIGKRLTWKDEPQELI